MYHSVLTSDIVINQVFSSLALISARATVTSLDVLTMLISSYLYLLCQGVCRSIVPKFSNSTYCPALDLRTLRNEFLCNLKTILAEEFATSFGSFIEPSKHAAFSAKLFRVMEQTFDKTTVMDNVDQMLAVAAAATPVIVEIFTNADAADLASPSLVSISGFRSRIAVRASESLETLRKEFLGGSRGAAPASAQLGKTRAMYEFVRKDLGIKMHGGENHGQFSNGIGNDDVSIGGNISKIYEVSLLAFRCRLRHSNIYLPTGYPRWKDPARYTLIICLTYRNSYISCLYLLYSIYDYYMFCNDVRNFGQ